MPYFEIFKKIEELNPLTPEVISRQATINIGVFLHTFHIFLILLDPIYPIKKN